VTVIGISNKNHVDVRSVGIYRTGMHDVVVIVVIFINVSELLR